MKESVCEPEELRSMKESACESGEAGGMQESVCKSGKPGNIQESVWESGEPGDMQESVCESGESVRSLNTRASRARALAVTTLEHNCGQVLVQCGTKLGPISATFGTTFGPKVGTNLEQTWDKLGTGMAPM